MRVKIIVGKLLYSIARWLPISYRPGGGIAKVLRYNTAKLVINKCGKNVNVERGAYFTHLLEIGDNSGLGINCNVSGKVIIGNNVLMAPNVIILTINHSYKDRTKLIKEQGNMPEKPVIIGNDVWIGTNVIILPGVHIGNGCVIGAGSVVTHDVKDYSVVAGNPARVVSERK